MPKNVNPETELVSIDEIEPHPDNPRIHSDSAVEKLADSIEEFGWTNPIIVNENDVILAGHARLKAAQELDMDEVPIIKLDLDDDEAKAYLLADNRIAEETEWDEKKLNEMVSNIDFDLSVAGFDEVELQAFDEDLDIDSYFEDQGQENEEQGELDEPEGTQEVVCPDCENRFTI